MLFTFFLILYFDAQTVDCSNLDFHFLAPKDYLLIKRDLTNEGFSFCEPPGYPDLPSKTLIVSKLDFTKTEGTKLISYEIPPVAKSSFERLEYEKGPIYETDEFYPERFFKVESIGEIRGVRVLKLTIYPFLYNPKRKTLLYNPLVIKCSLPNISLNRLSSLDTLKNFFARFPIWFKIAIDSSGVYKITGQELKAAGLNLALIKPKGIKVFNIGKWESNKYYPDSMIEIPILVFSKDTNSFKEEDYIIFYGQGPSHFSKKGRHYIQNLYTLYNYYWLTFSDEPGKRMKMVSAMPDRSLAFSSVGKGVRHFEKDSDCPARGGLLWVWDALQKPGWEESKSFYYHFILPKARELLDIKFRLFSEITGFNLEVYLNSIPLDTLFRVNASPPEGFVYQKQKNLPTKEKLTLELKFKHPKDLIVYSDYFEFTYLFDLSFDNAPFEVIIDSIGKSSFKILNPKPTPIILDVSDPYSPKLLKDFAIKGDSLFFSYYIQDTTTLYFSLLKNARKIKKIENKSQLAVSDIHTLTADYFIIAPDELFSAAKELAKYRQGNIPGLEQGKVSVVKLSSIYDHYTFGIEEPYALKKFFALKRPIYGLLLGDATYDYRGLVYPKPKVPTYEVGYHLDFEVYETRIYAKDAYFADFEGEGSSPDFVLTRLTARNPKEVMSYLAKLKAYEKGSLGVSAKRFLFLADDEYEGARDIPDRVGPGTHINNCENLIPRIPRHFDVLKLYLTEYPFLGIRDKTNARDDFLKALKSGVGYAIYFGHGAGFQLAHEKLLTLPDIPNIKNGLKCPFGFFGSCGVGRFEDTKYESVAEELVRSEEGFIATVAAVRATSSPSNEAFMREMLVKLFAQNTKTLGEVFFSAWRINVQYHFFGEPAIKVILPNRGDVALELTPQPFLPASEVLLEGALPHKKAELELALSLGKRERKYKSKHLTTKYHLPGFEIFRVKKTLSDSNFSFSFLFPRGLSLDTIFLGSPENYYFELPKTLRLSLYYKTKEGSYSFSIDTLMRDTTFIPFSDTIGPVVELFAFGKRLYDTVRVPRVFTLEGRIFDCSGIFLAKGSPYSPKLFLKEKEECLSDILSFQDGYGFFRMPITLDEEEIPLRVTIYDNLLNKSEKKLYLKTQLMPKIKIDKPLFVQSGNHLYLTFSLSEPGIGELVIYTIQGRRVFAKSDFYCSLGYNQILIDPKDLPNGVYLYRLNISSLVRKDNVSVIDKFIIAH